MNEIYRNTTVIGTYTYQIPNHCILWGQGMLIGQDQTNQFIFVWVCYHYLSIVINLMICD